LYFVVRTGQRGFLSVSQPQPRRLEMRRRIR